MNRSDKSWQVLVDAASHDMRVRAQLEKAGLLDAGYNPTMRVVHGQNAQLLEDFIAGYGWPYPSTHGKKARRAAWFIAIHAISKPRILHIALQLLKEGMEKGESVALEYAKLFDRIELYEGRLQQYGTQFSQSPHGWYAYSLFEPEKVDERRAQLGLSTFEEGKKECGTDEDGFVTQEEMDRENAQFSALLKEIGWCN